MNFDKIKNEPLALIGACASIGLAAVATLSGQGFISDAVAGRATDVLTSFGQLLVVAAPFLTALTGRRFVYGPETVKQIDPTISGDKLP